MGQRRGEDLVLEQASWQPMQLHPSSMGTRRPLSWSLFPDHKSTLQWVDFHKGFLQWDIMTNLYGSFPSLSLRSNRSVFAGRSLCPFNTYCSAFLSPILPPHQMTLFQLPQPTSKLPKQQPKRSSLQGPQPTPLYIIKTATLCSAANNV